MSIKLEYQNDIGLFSFFIFFSLSNCCPFFLQGNVEELFDVDLGSYAIAAAEDCNRRLGDYVNFEVLNAIQRTEAKTWVSDKPYDKDACLPDFNVLLFDARKLDNNLVDVIAWWSKILNLGTQRFPISSYTFCVPA